MKKKVISLMLAACMVMGMTACGSSASTTDSQPAADGTTSETQAATTDAAAQTTESTGDKELAVQIGPDPETIDPALNSAVDGGNMLLHAYECLLTVGEDGTLQP